jgi:hypothetical protein
MAARQKKQKVEDENSDDGFGSGGDDNFGSDNDNDNNNDDGGFGSDDDHAAIDETEDTKAEVRVLSEVLHLLSYRPPYDSLISLVNDR